MRTFRAFVVVVASVGVVSLTAGQEGSGAASTDPHGQELALKVLRESIRAAEARNAGREASIATKSDRLERFEQRRARLGGWGRVATIGGSVGVVFGSLSNARWFLIGSAAVLSWGFFVAIPLDVSYGAEVRRLQTHIRELEDKRAAETAGIQAMLNQIGAPRANEP